MFSCICLNCLLTMINVVKLLDVTVSFILHVGWKAHFFLGHCSIISYFFPIKYFAFQINFHEFSSDSTFGNYCNKSQSLIFCMNSLDECLHTLSIFCLEYLELEMLWISNVRNICINPMRYLEDATQVLSCNSFIFHLYLIHIAWS